MYRRLTALVAYVTTRTYASANDQWARFACSLVNSSKTKRRQSSSVTSLCKNNLTQRQSAHNTNYDMLI